MGLLDAKRDDFNREYFEPQIEDSKTGLELPGIVDEVIAMTELRPEHGEVYRAFVCRRPNQWGYSASDRSGKLDLVEPPHLGQLMRKIRDNSHPDTDSYNYDIAAANRGEKACLMILIALITSRVVLTLSLRGPSYL